MVNERARRWIRRASFASVLAVAVACTESGTIFTSEPETTRKQTSGVCGDGSPILVVLDTVSATNSANLYPSFIAEILKTEGYKSFTTAELSALTGTCLATHATVILPAITITPTEETLFRDFVTNGGHLVAFRPKVASTSTFYSDVFNVSYTGTSTDSHVCPYVGATPTRHLCAGSQVIRAAEDINPATGKRLRAECKSDNFPDGDTGSTGMECSFCTTSAVRLRTTHPAVQGLTTAPLGIHSAARRVTALTGTQVLADLETSGLQPSPAVAHYQHASGGRATLFTYNLAESIALTRQGNPWQAGIANYSHYLVRSTHYAADENITASDRPAQMFANVNTGLNWNNQWRSEFRGRTSDFANDIPQADEQARFLGNILRWGLRSTLPLPRLWYFPDGIRSMVTLSSDGCTHGGDPHKARVQLQAEEVRRAGGNAAFYGFVNDNPLTMVAMTPSMAATLSTADAGAHEIGIHYNIADEHHYTYDEMQYGKTGQTGLNDQRDMYMTQYAVAPHNVAVPTTTRMHTGRWTSTGASDNDGGMPYENYPAAQAKLLASPFGSYPGDRLDSSYISFPRTFGMMTGAAVPMKMLDVCASSGSQSIIDLYEHNTTIEDDVQFFVNSGSTGWPVSVAARRFEVSMAEGFWRYATVHNPLFHSLHWSDAAGGIRPYGLQFLDLARAHGVPVVAPRDFLTHWAARADVTMGSFTYSNGQASFVMKNVLRDQSLLMPIEVGSATLSSVLVDGSSVAFSVEEIEGSWYGRLKVAAGVTAPDYERTVVASYATAYAASGTLGVDGANSVVLLTGIEGSSPGRTVHLSVRADASGGFTFPKLAGGQYEVRPISPTRVFTPATATFTLSSAASLTFSSAAGATPYGAGLALMPDETPSLDDPNPTARQLGVRFKSDVAGAITRLRLFRRAESSARTAYVWTTGGVRVGRADFPAAGKHGGWQEQELLAPVTVPANTTMVAAFVAPSGEAAPYLPGGFDTPLRRGPLQTDPDGSGSVSVSGSVSALPSTSEGNDNYMIDVNFVPFAESFHASPTPSASTASSGTAYMLGMRFSVTTEGQLNALRYYRAAGETGTHYGMVWRVSDNAVMATAQFTNEDGSSVAGWQQQNIPPVPLATGTEYVIGVNSGSNHSNYVYPYEYTGLATASTNGLVSVPGTPNGVYGTFNTSSPFLTTRPTSSYLNTDYFRDIVYSRAQSLYHASTDYVDHFAPVDEGYELGSRFTSDVNGTITAVKFYQAANSAGKPEGGPHVGKVWGPDHRLLATATFPRTNKVGWVEVALDRPLPIRAETEYTVSVNAGIDVDGQGSVASDGDSGVPPSRTWLYAARPGMATVISFRHLQSVGNGGGVYGPIGTCPQSSYYNYLYFRDVVFVPD